VNIVTRRAIPRRTMLRGIGVGLALPLLESMIPAFATLRAAASRPTRRFGAVYVPNGMIMKNFTPVADGALELTPILSPLKEVRDYLVVPTGLYNRAANPTEGEGAGAHARASGSFLTGAHPKKTDGPGMRAGISLDQIVANEFGRDTQLASLELSVDSKELAGGCDPGYACTYSRTIAWRSETTPLSMENGPRVVFERLFGDVASTDPGERLARRLTNRSILDSVGEEVIHLRGRLGPPDRTKLTEYLEAVRDVERRIQKEEEQSAREVPLVEQPMGGIPATFGEHVKLLLDLQALAFQCDLTRVFTLMMGREGSRRSYPEIGVPDAHHPLTHTYEPEPVAKVTKINTYHMEMFAYFLKKLQAMPDGDGSLLDHSLMIYGGGISDGNAHVHENVPVVLAGGAVGRIGGGRHIRYANQPPLANLWLTVLDKLGIPAERMGESTGRLERLSGV
jgi:hypothetical protein